MRLTSYRSLAVSLALCAMVVRALLPEGWMPAASAAATGSPLVICSFDGMAHGGKAPAAPGQERGHAPCAFAAIAPFSPPASMAALAPIAHAIARLAPLAAAGSPAAISNYRPNAPRGPPAFS